MGWRWHWSPSRHDNPCRQLDQSRSALLFSLDLTAVFDKVNYDLLIHCLAAIGLQETVLQWLVSFHGQGQKEALGQEMSMNWCWI